jgi:E3 ubiquitin-protein ligase HUWE1
VLIYIYQNKPLPSYVRLVVEMRTLRSIALQISAFTYGFHELVPQPLVAPFAPPELELLISGLPDIDVLDLRANTEYGGKGGSLG